MKYRAFTSPMFLLGAVAVFLLVVPAFIVGWALRGVLWPVHTFKLLLSSLIPATPQQPPSPAGAPDSGGKNA